jgi:hypothetical protein
MWVHAPAGYGKTAIAGTISKMLEETVGVDFSPLGATFFFWRTSPERNNPARFIVTIAHQLAMSIPELEPRIADAVARCPLVLKKALEVQLVKLIVEPFQALDNLQDMPNRLVIIDGLDECINSEQESRLERKYAEDQERAQARVLELIRALQSYHLPLSFLILSRPEPWIKQHIESRVFTDLVEVVDLYAVGDHMKDVEDYVRAELSRIASNFGFEDWPTEDIVGSFVRKANGHMVYASTVIRHTDDPYDDPRKRLEVILDASSDSHPDLALSTSFSSLYELYRQILRTCPESSRSLMIEVLEDIIVASHYFNEALGFHRALATLDSLSSRAAGCGARAIRGLHAVLHLLVVPNDKLGSLPGPLQSLNPFIHSSFVEFVTNPILSLEFAVDTKKGARRVLWSCLECMSTITSQSDEKEGVLQFALHAFQSLWFEAWSGEEEVRLCLDEYVKLVQRLLTLDLATGFVKFSRPMCFPSSFVYVSPIIVQKFLGSLEHLPKAFDPLPQQAIVHVLSSTDRPIDCLYNQSGFLWLGSDRAELYAYLKSLEERSTNSSRQKSDEVAQALSWLRADINRYFHSVTHHRPNLSLGWSSYIRPILDYIRHDDAHS